MAEMGHSLSSVINTSTSDVDNFVALANKYAEMRTSLEMEYSGAELETQLNKLSEAFDLTVGILAHERATTARLRMGIELARIAAHNQLLNQNTTKRFFDSAYIEYDKEKINNIFLMVTNSIRESIEHFAQLTRQFVLENGAITTERDEDALLAILRSTPESSRGFSFDNLKSINEILSRSFGSSDTPRSHVRHQETMFTELGRIIQTN
jgi:N-acetylglutamate synthase-like GNAT family acetyltransferase